MNQDILKERNRMIKDLEKTFSMALDAGDYKAAIQAKHMIGKMQGFFDCKKNKKQNLSLIELNAEELEMLLCEAEDIKKWSIPPTNEQNSKECNVNERNNAKKHNSSEHNSKNEQ